MRSEADSDRAAQQPPAVPEQSSQAGATEAMLPVASVAKRLGVAPSTLRTWDRRYGLGPTRHTGGRHRRYGVADIGRLELMQRALLRGASTAEAAQYALQRMPKSPARPHGSHPDVTASPAATLHIDTPDGEVVLPAEGDDEVARHELGAAQLARRLGAQARSMNVAATRVTLEESISLLGAARAWEEVHEPVLDALHGRGTHPGDTSARGDAASLLDECVLATLIRANPVFATPRERRPVLLVAPAGVRATLPLYALAAGLGAYGLVAQPLGSDLPVAVLATAVRRAAPAALVLWASEPAQANPELFTRLSRARQPRRSFAGGPGWHAESLPSTVEALPDVGQAIERLVRVAG